MKHGYRPPACGHSAGRDWEEGERMYRKAESSSSAWASCAGDRLGREPMLPKCMPYEGDTRGSPLGVSAISPAPLYSERGVLCP